MAHALRFLSCGETCLRSLMDLFKLEWQAGQTEIIVRSKEQPFPASSLQKYLNAYARLQTQHKALKPAQEIEHLRHDISDILKVS